MAGVEAMRHAARTPAVDGAITMPRITVVTPSFNQGAFLERTIQSVLGQRYPNLEYIIIDGGSTDQSVEIIKRYAAQLSHWESEPDHGPAHALTKGFARSTGHIMAWLNADDVYLSNALHIVGQVFRDYPKISWLTSGSICISAADQLFVIQTSRKILSRWTQLFLCSPPPQQCTFWRRALWDQAGGTLEESTRFMDCELWLRFYEHAHPYLVDTILGAWRLHAGSFSAGRLRVLHAEIDKAQRGYLQGYLKAHRGVALLAPWLKFYFKAIDRGILNRIAFELWARRRRLLTFDLATCRFGLRPGGWWPQPWPVTIGDVEGRGGAETGQGHGESETAKIQRDT